MNATVEADTRAKATEITKTINTPDTVCSCADSSSVIGNGELTTVNFRSGFPVASLSID